MPLVNMKDMLQHAYTHVIIYNVEGLDQAGAQTMMAEGRRVLLRHYWRA